MRGHRFHQREIDHETELPPVLPIARLFRVVEDPQLGGARIKTAEPDCIGHQHPLGFFQGCEGSQVHRHQYMLVHLLEEFGERFAEGHVLPFNFSIFFLPDDVFQKGRKASQRLDI